MKKEIIVTADSVDQALEQTAAKLMKKREDLSYEVLQNEKKNIFGKIKKRAQVKVFYFENDAKEEEKPAAPSAKEPENVSNRAKSHKNKEQLLEKKIERAQEYLLDILGKMGVENARLEVDRKKDHVAIKMEGENISIAVGRRGETMNTIQYLVSTVVNRMGGEYTRFVLDSGNFREKREETLKNLAMNISKKVIRSGKTLTLGPMNSYERRIVHMVISLTPGVFSKSVGVEPNRKVAVYADNNNNSSSNNNSNTRHNKKKNRPNYDNKNYSPKDVSNQPSTYDFEKEFLKSSNNNKLYTKVDLNEKDS